MNRRGFLASLAALAVAPSLPAPVVDSFAGIDRSVAPLMLPHFTGLQGWLPEACVIGSMFCPRDKVYLVDGPEHFHADGVEFMGLDRSKPTLIAHVSAVDELRAAIDDACAKVARVQQNEMFAG